MFECAPEIIFLDDMTGHEDEGSDEENPKNDNLE